MSHRKVPENLVTFKYIVEKGDFFGESIPVSTLEAELGADWKTIQKYMDEETIFLSGHRFSMKSCYKTHTDKELGLIVDFDKPFSRNEEHSNYLNNSEL